MCVFDVKIGQSATSTFWIKDDFFFFDLSGHFILIKDNFNIKIKKD